MKDIIKMSLMVTGIIILSIIQQIIYGNQGSIIIGLILLFGFGFGWYAYKVCLEDKKDGEERWLKH